MEAIDTAIHSTYQLLDVMWPQGSGCLEGVPRALGRFLFHSLDSGDELVLSASGKVAEGAHPLQKAILQMCDGWWW